MTTLSIKDSANSVIILRIIALLVLFIIQIEITEIALRYYYNASNVRQSIWVDFHSNPRYVFSFIFVFIAALLVAARLRLRSHIDALFHAIKIHSWRRYLPLQIIVYIAFASLTWFLSTQTLKPVWLSMSMLGIWLLLSISCAALMLMSLAPFTYWKQVFHTEKNSLYVALIAGLMTMALTSSLIQSWPSMVEVTLRFSAYLLQLVYPDVIFNVQSATLGTSRFEVEVTQACAGYEGIALIVVFLSLYLWLFKDELRFPRVLLLFPVGIATMWLFNSVRIAALVGIGASYSEEIAVAGFHSNAGWIAFILVSVGLISVMYHVPYFNVRSRDQHTMPSQSAKQATALLVPMMVLLAATLLTSAASSGFDWLYPVKVVVTAAALGIFWRGYVFSKPFINSQSVLIGVAVFFLWIFLVPFESEKTTLFADELVKMTPWLTGFWLVFRFIGSAITVPFAEELAFRGYILSRLSGTDLNLNQKIRFSLLPFVGSSLLFGVFHGAWLAGTLAGMAYAIARYRRGQVSDAILAHMTTNALLSIYVLATQQWSYW